MKSIENPKGVANPSKTRTDKSWFAATFQRLARPLASMALASSMVAVPVNADSANAMHSHAQQHSALAAEHRHGNGDDVTGTESKAIYGDNWSGYVAVSNLKHPKPLVTSITGTWRVPTLKDVCNISNPARGLYDTMTWIGIGGMINDSSLIQIGTEDEFESGKMHYSAWYEVMPNGSTDINLTINPGDTISATIRLVDPDKNLWKMTLKNLTTGISAAPITLTYTSSRLTAEWVVENPTEIIEGYPILTEPLGYPQISFVYDGPTEGNFATIGETTGTIGQFPNVPVVISESGDKLLSSGPLLVNGPGGAHIQQFSVLRIQVPIIVPSKLSNNGGSFNLDLQHCPE